ncbi:MAG: UDP-N-acetylglucosamine--N-acetylmuramyl-(pentapeptide) pyrophosphoryl-undecaprenol N-acetylglucosamine transferase [Planctomycetota bacterium]|jgi:UDP-N-acetylglucosamine--N-acetylmuramyl-(pentapeptide) pyrophosphoryl-undecaprenol N-acetylglucosamine transferase
MSHDRILIMAGGTGGHVYPALAVADYLRDRGAGIRWLGTETGLEARVVPAKGYSLSTIKVAGLRGKSLMSLLLAPFMLFAAILHALVLIRQFKPDAVLGMGGYVSGPGGVAAWLLRVPLYIHEQNAIAGLTNRLLAPLSKMIMQGFPDTFDAGSRVKTTGNPVRSEIIRSAKVETRNANDEKDHVCLLVLGGSLGARALNQTVPSALKCLSAECHFQIWHQTGTQHFQETKGIYEKFDLHEARVDAYIEDMAGAYEWADLVLCRAGALTLAELCVSGLASILVPYPHAVDDHQTVNARYLSDKGAAILLPETDLQADTLATLLSGLCNARSRLHDMAAKTRQLAQVDATVQVAQICLGGASA